MSFPLPYETPSRTKLIRWFKENRRRGLVFGTQFYQPDHCRKHGIQTCDACREFHCSDNSVCYLIAHRW